MFLVELFDDLLLEDYIEVKEEFIIVEVVLDFF